MKQLLDFLPLLVFFIAYKAYDVRVAAAALIVASTLALIYSWYRFRKLDKANIITYLLVVIFGGLTIYFNKLEYLEWKVTIVYLLFAAALLYSQWWMKNPLIQSLLGKELTLPNQVWRRLNIAWVLFFLFCAAANYYVASTMSEDTWATFKVFGLTGLTLFFTLLNGLYIYRYISDNKKSPHSDKQDDN